jgi:hypothetical protein
MTLGGREGGVTASPPPQGKFIIDFSGDAGAAGED